MSHLRRALPVLLASALTLSAPLAVPTPARAAVAAADGECPRSEVPDATPTPWSAQQPYPGGTQVTHAGSRWRAWQDAQLGEEPGVDPWNAWEELVRAEDGTIVWTPSRWFDDGDVVLHQGVRWIAAWCSRNQQPVGDGYGPWVEAEVDDHGAKVWRATLTFRDGDVVLHHGVRYVAHWETRNQDPVSTGPFPYGPWEERGRPGWNTAVSYIGGDQVRHAGSFWQALWSSRGATPDADPGGPWQEVATAGDGTPAWTPSHAFGPGATVVYGGRRYVARWWSRNQEPGSPAGAWRAVADDPYGTTAAWAPHRAFQTGDAVTRDGSQYVARWWNRGEEPGTDSGAAWREVREAALSTAPPAVTGVARVGATMTTDAGGWGGADVAVGFQWFVAGEPVPGATGRSYSPPPSAAGRPVFVAVTATGAGLSPTTVASAVLTVAPGVLTTPGIRIVGKSRVGKRLRVADGAWPEATQVTYQWRVGGKPVRAGRKLKLTERMRGKRVQLQVTAAAAGYAAVVLTVRGKRVHRGRHARG